MPRHLCLSLLVYVLRSVTGWYPPGRPRGVARHSAFWGVCRLRAPPSPVPAPYMFPGPGMAFPPPLSSPRTECRHGIVVGPRHRPACVPDEGGRVLLLLAATLARPSPPGPQAAQWRRHARAEVTVHDRAKVGGERSCRP